MKKNSIILFCLFALACLNAFSAEINVADVHRNIPLSDDENVYKDFYLNAGEGSGLKKYLVVNVKRKVFIKDSASKSIGDFETTIGQLRILHVDSKLAVAREYKLFSRDEEPMVEQTGIMTGDRIDLTGSFIDTAKPAKKKIAENVSNEAGLRLPADTNEALPNLPNTKGVSPLRSATPLATPEI